MRAQLRVLAFIALALAPLLAIDLLVLQQQMSAARDVVIGDRLSLVRAAGAAIDNYVAGNIQTLVAMAQGPGYRGATPATANGLVEAVLREDPNWASLALIDGEGWNISSLYAPARTVNVADRDYFQAAMRGERAIGAVVIGRGTNVRTIVLAVPITFQEGTRGVLTGALSLQNLESTLRAIVASPSIRLRIADRNGQEFIGPEATGDALPTITDRPGIARALAGGSSSEVTADRLLAYANVPTARWAIELSEPTSSAFAVADRANVVAGALAAAGLMAALLIAWYLGGRLSRSYGELKRARTAADAERLRLREAIRRAPAHVGLLRGPDLVVDAVSDEQLGVLDRKEEDVVGRPFRELIPDAANRSVLERVHASGEPFVAREMRITRRLPDGVERDAYYNASIVPTWDADGRVDGVIYYATDVTDLVRSRLRLEELAGALIVERDELQQILNELPEGVVVVRKDGVVTRNRALDRLFGIEPTTEWAVAMRSVHRRRPNGHVIPVEESVVTRAFLRGMEVHAEEQILRLADGTERNVFASSVPIRQTGEIVAAVAVYQDITPLKVFEAQRTEFFTMASHEIRTPVAAIQLQLELADRYVARGQAERVPELVRGALQRVKGLGELIRDLLDLSRIDEGHLEFELEELDARDAARQVVAEFPSDETHAIRASVSDEPVRVRTDRRRLREVVENLLSNALKYSPNGGEVEVEVRAEGRSAVIRVRDKGIGVPEEDRERIFTRFFRTSRAKPYGGAGLGLYISREMVHGLGGDLVVESTSEGGSVFAIALPLVAEPAGAPEAETAEDVRL